MADLEAGLPRLEEQAAVLPIPLLRLEDHHIILGAAAGHLNPAKKHCYLPERKEKRRCLEYTPEEVRDIKEGVRIRLEEKLQRTFSLSDITFWVTEEKARGANKLASLVQAGAERRLCRAAGGVVCIQDIHDEFLKKDLVDASQNKPSQKNKRKIPEPATDATSATNATDADDTMDVAPNPKIFSASSEEEVYEVCRKWIEEEMDEDAKARKMKLVNIFLVNLTADMKSKHADIRETLLVFTANTIGNFMVQHYAKYPNDCLPGELNAWNPDTPDGIEDVWLPCDVEAADEGMDVANLRHDLGWKVEAQVGMGGSQAICGGLSQHSNQSLPRPNTAKPVKSVVVENEFVDVEAPGQREDLVLSMDDMELEGSRNRGSPVLSTMCNNIGHNLIANPSSQPPQLTPRQEGPWGGKKIHIICACSSLPIALGVLVVSLLNSWHGICPLLSAFAIVIAGIGRILILQKY